MNNDLISREALKKALSKEIWTNDMSMWLKLLNVIDNAPAVEIDESVIQEILNKRCMTAVANEYLVALHNTRPQGEPVIKCQDCKYRVKEWREDRRMKEKGYWVYGCKHFGEIMGYWGFGGNDNEFCSDAERKGGAE